MYSASLDLLYLGQPYDEVRRGVERAVKREAVRKNFLEILPLMYGHFQNISPAFVQKVQPRFYPAGRDILIPFTPPFIYGVDGKVFFPWLSFWRSNPLSGLQLSLFTTLVQKVLRDDPDLEDAEFDILDFSASGPKTERTLTIVSSVEVDVLSEEQLTEMLYCFAEGFSLAQAALEKAEASKSGREDEERVIDPRQIDLFH
jgi:hypothetical protein